MPRGRRVIDRGHDRVGVSMLTQVRMPQLAPRTITYENMSSVDRGFLSCAKGPLEIQAPEDGQVNLSLIIKRGGYYQYLRDNGYPKHFPLDEHLFPFIQQLTLDDLDADDAAVIAEREYSATDSITRASTIVPAIWEVHGQPKFRFSFSGLSLLPSASAYSSDDYSQFCLLGQILKGSTPSCFAGDTTSWNDYYQLSVEQEGNVKFLPASKNKGWNPRRLPDRTYLAAYLAYWLSTFVVPYGEEGYIRPEVLYPACALADGDLWDTISKAGKVVKLEPKVVVLPPSFSPIPDASYISEPIKKKSSSPRPKKRRAVKAGGASKRVARESAIEDPLPEEPAPSDAIVEDADFVAQNDEGIGDMETDDYHPIRNGVPFSDEEGILVADDPGRGDIEMDTGIGQTPTGSYDQDKLPSYDENMSTSFQEIYDLLDIEVDPELPEYQEGAATSIHDIDWTEILQNATIITSGAEMPGFPTLEEGELPREIISKGNGSALVGSDPAHPVEGAISGDLEITPHDHLGEELTGGAATGYVSMVDDTVESPPTPRVGADVEASGATCFAMGDVDGGTIIGAASHRDDSAPPGVINMHVFFSRGHTSCSSRGGGLVPVQRPDFPPHGIVWPDDSQTGSEQGIGFLIEPFIRSIRMVIEAEFPPSIDKVRDCMKASTRAYHLMGLPRDPWMAGIDSMWAEVWDLHAKSVRESIDLQIRQLGGDISALESRLADTCTRVAAVGTRQTELASSSAALMDEISLLEQAIERASIRLAELKPALAVTTEAEKNVTAEMEVLDQERLALEHELAAKKSMMMDLQIQISPSS
ncbi:hypothetical protein Taro_040531 [Colocasia esculenta]|uniref:Aminotransferase-like plant mobile domain-containing protein n=1 Tax=Colocasia esculenta TaxID=4460 RepID=A0A843WTA7_COLES|nr:hypothetical protein [Colocasia esculenta]